MAERLELLPGSIEVEKNIAELHIWRLLKEFLSNDFGFLGYRVLPLGNKNIHDTPSFTVISKKYGLIFIDVCTNKLESIDEEEYWCFSNSESLFSRDALAEFFEDEAKKRLKRSNETYNRRKRRYNLPINRLVIFYENTNEELDTLEMEEIATSEYISNQNIEKLLQDKITGFEESEISESIISETFSLLEGTSSYQSKKPVDPELKTVNDFIQKSLNLTFKQDRAQRQISLQLPNGPQRIRGLAGTGKTVVLSLKSALTHFQYPKYKILYLFNTQSLYNQIEKLVEDYYVPEAGAIPNWSNLEILHAWGGESKPGLYYNLCKKYGLQPLTWGDVRGRGDGLNIIYNHLLTKIGDKLTSEYDMVLIDEAQDFPQPLFEVIYKITKKPKRIVWAYDEFQSLKELKIREPDELFGLGKDSTPNISKDDLKGIYEGGIRKDFILPNCYRNPRLTLMVAHSVALGLYSKSGLVDSIDSVADWNALGYNVTKPENKNQISESDEVEILRDSEHSKNRLEQFLTEEKKNPRNLLQVQSFGNKLEQASSVVDEILRLINEEDVSPEEIIVITLDTRNAEDDLAEVRSLLNKKQVQSITPGFVEKSSAFKERGFVTLTTPFRAKGNEGNVVFVLNSQKTLEDYNFRGRNSFFVSVTRSRGWCHLFGVGSNMDELISEIDRIREDYPFFKFTRPDDEFIQRRRIILSKSDKELAETNATIDKLIDQDSEILIEQLKLKGLL